ncbi:MAG: hypothetical protein E6R14_04945 [Thermomicrobiales bacterium]|nr:MAG: hypothetical protein E6R14_04945 [Thermomicrobiales bacterium]
MVWLRIVVFTGVCMMFTASLAQAGNGNNGNFWSNGNFWNNVNFWKNGNFRNWDNYGNGYVRAVPIPSTEVLFGLGFAALTWIGPKITRRRYSSVS